MCQPPAAGSQPGALQSICFTVFKPLAPQKRSVLSSLDRYGSKGQSCHMPGASWPSKSPQKAPKVLPSCCIFSRVGSKVAFFSLLFVCFSRRSDPRSARAGAVETQFVIFGVSSKRVSFLQQLLKHSWYIWRGNPLKKHFKIELEHRSCKSVLVLLPGSIFASFWTPYGASFVPLGC